ncbi:MAG: low molecular weight phosphotyrosine protein phosphatase [Muribaculaceae bacterium]|nr:low molecular weight phosphotyrosine protein phosphatase [Muribaculaceae bacterium]
MKRNYEIATLTKPVKILFVCLGNICRSPAAQGVMQSLIERKGTADMFVLDSAGTYGGHAGDLPDNRMRVHARRRGYDLTHKSRRIIGDDFERFDLIITMDDSNLHTLKNMAATIEEERKIIPMATFIRQYPHADCVPDPYYEGAEGFEYVLDLLEDACLGLYDAIIARQ